MSCVDGISALDCAERLVVEKSC